MLNTIIKYNNNNIDPILELYRGKIYCQIIKIFINLITTKLGTKIFSIKKSYYRTLTNILSSWMFTLYALQPYNKDPFFPDSFEETLPLYNIIYDLCKYDNTILNCSTIIKDIINEFIYNISIQINIFNKYKQSIFYKQIKNNFTITKYIYTQKRNNLFIYFYKFKIYVPFNIIDKRLINILDNILVPLHIYYKLQNIYTGLPQYLDIFIWCICFRYQLLGSNNHQLSILPKNIYQMYKDFNLYFECFASAINYSLPNYCSIYFDLEQYFGSKGNFFTLNIIEGTYMFNPPYQINIIEYGINKLLYHLYIAKNNNKHLTFIITIPIWDKEGQNIINYHNKIDYGDCYIINKIKQSEFLIGIRLITKDKFTYFDHNFILFKNITIQHTYIIMLSSNKNILFNKIMDYDFMV